MKTHRDLEAWKEAIKLTRTVYEMTRCFPREELFGITGQMRRASVSVASNIAEGAARGSSNDFRRFLLISRGSLSELETLAIIAGQVGLLDAASVQRLRGERDHVSLLLQGLIDSLAPD